MQPEDVDVVVVGMGPGGEDAGGRLASAGLRVVGVESRLLGGECPYFACIPTKMMVRAADALAEGRRVDELAGQAQVRPDWTLVADRIRDEATTDWDDRAAVERFEDTGGLFIRGTGRLTGPEEVTVATPDGERIFRASRAIVLNPGTEPSVPPIDGLDDVAYWTNREAVRVREVPRSLVVLGGGPVGLEFAQVFSRFGADTSVVEAAERLLPGGEPAVSDCIAEVFRGEGIGVHTGAAARRVRPDAQYGNRIRVELETGAELVAERLLVATGRRTDLAGLGVRAVGLDDAARTIPVDDRMRAAEKVWAIGDVTGHGAFTHTSVYQARIAAADILQQDEENGRSAETADYRALPAVTFTDPEVAQVGLTEADARTRGLSVRTAVTPIPSTARGWIHKAGNDGLLHLVIDGDRDILVGGTVLAPAGGEVVGALAVAVQAEVPLSVLRRMILAYPTFHRALDAALANLDA